MSTPPSPPASRRSNHRRLIGRGLAIAFFALVAFLIYRYGSTLDWRKIGRAVRQIDRATLLMAAVSAAASYGVYACIDLFARQALQLPIGRARAMATAFVCYAFNLNFGSWVGSIGFRYRLYSRVGLDAGQVTRIVAISLVTNWSGYLVLGGVLFTFGFVKPPPDWAIAGLDPALALRLIGALLLAVAAIYLGAAAFARQRRWTIRGRELNLPGVRFAALQMLVSSLNWMLIAGVLFALLRSHVDFPTALGVFLLASIAGAATHVPAGLGVLEAVFYSLLGSRVPHAELFAALLAFRALYYLAPLSVAVPLYFLLEARSRADSPGAVKPGSRLASDGRPAAART